MFFTTKLSSLTFDFLSISQRSGAEPDVKVGLGVELRTIGLFGRHGAEATEDSGHAVRTDRGLVEGSGTHRLTRPLRLLGLGGQGELRDTPQPTLAGCLISLKIIVLSYVVLNFLN